jgi:hypothetical protein
MSSDARLETLATDYKKGVISGKELATMMERGEITKSQRRKIVRLSSHLKELSERQKLRVEAKEKKMLPKLTRDDRRNKYAKALTELEIEREKEAAKFMTCLGCRKRGHLLKDCPRVLARKDADATVNRCFNCGDTEHTLKDCPQPRNPDKSLPFSTCFICKQVGHISRDCPENPNGLYPKGGCCHICMQKTHLAKDCPERTEEDILRHEMDKKRKRGGDSELDGDNDKSAPRLSSTADDTTARGDDYLDDSSAFLVGGNQSDNEDEDDGDNDGGASEKKAKKRKTSEGKEKKSKKPKKSKDSSKSKK